MISIGSSGSNSCAGCALMPPIISHRSAGWRHDRLNSVLTEAPRRLEATAGHSPATATSAERPRPRRMHAGWPANLLGRHQLTATGEDGRA